MDGYLVLTTKKRASGGLEVRSGSCSVKFSDAGLQTAS